MWNSGRNEKASRCPSSKRRRFCERWCELFGSLPPKHWDRADASQAGRTRTAGRYDAADARSGSEDGLSKSSIKRKVETGEFPAPTHISVRRIGWPHTAAVCQIASQPQVPRCPRQSRNSWPSKTSQSRNRPPFVESASAMRRCPVLRSNFIAGGCASWRRVCWR